MSHKTEYIWTCKIGGPAIQFQSGADAPMRQAVQAAFKQVTGNHEAFCFSGWGGELTEGERAVVERRSPRAALATQSGAVGEPLGYMNAGHVYELQQKRINYAYVYPNEEVGASVAIYVAAPTEAKPATQQASGEREAFEAWARPKWRHPEDFDQLIKGAPGDYNSIEVQAAWLAWQARAALSTPAQQDAVDADSLAEFFALHAAELEDTPNDLPSVGTEDAIVRHYTEQVMQVVNDVPMDAARTQWGVDACEMLRDLVAERDELASRVRELEGALDRSRQQFVDVSVAFMSFVPESEAAAKGLLQKLGDAHGYGWCQQALGEMWDVKHNCAPRGSMGVTVGKCNPPKLWTKRSQDAYRKGWNDRDALTPAPNEAAGAIYERCAQIAFDADHMGSVNLKLLKNRIGNSIRAALASKEHP